MADLKKVFATSKEKENEGVWTDDLGDGLKLKIARMKNPRFRKMYERMTKPYKRQIRLGTLPEETEIDIICKCISQTVLLDWQNLSVDGKKQDYNQDNAYKILKNPEIGDFRDFVVDLANDIELFREEDLEDSEKNLQSGSTGKLTGEST